VSAGTDAGPGRGAAGRNVENLPRPANPSRSGPRPSEIEAVIAAKRTRRLATIPTAYRKLFERSYTGKASPRASIKAFCLECIGFERAAITDCTASACPLWRLRPYQKKGGT
jgi:hypothetical protein